MNDWLQPTTDEERELLADFEAHFQRLSAESGRALAGYVRDQAWVQVLLYARHLRAFANEVSETEVRLLRPDAISPGNRRFAIEGVVDVVESKGQRKMYDIKTHTPVDGLHDESLTESISQQLTLYASLWERVRGERLTGIGIIATKPSAAVDTAVRAGDDEAISKVLEGWAPVKLLKFSEDSVEETIRAFGGVVDKIEEGCFPPRAAADLNKREPGARTVFGVETCRNCGGRHGCSSFKGYQAEKEIKVDMKQVTALKRAAALVIVSSAEEAEEEAAREDRDNRAAVNLRDTD
jgi:hypothetical protein